jgi:hypothetical protein
MILTIILTCLLAVSAVSAADISVEDVSTGDFSNMIGDESNADLASPDTDDVTADENSFAQINQAVNENDGDAFNDGIATSSDLDQTDSGSSFNKSNSECCSFLIQEENETVFAFRQDSPLNGNGVRIHNASYEGLDVIVQEIDNTLGGHFIHAIITEDGWIASHGGDSSNITHVLNLERLAIEMLVSKNISSDSLAAIQKDFNDLFDGYGHFFIKAPDGRYGIVFGETCVYGTVNPGEFLIIPNVYYGYRKGNYSDYGINPVDAMIEICSYENTGWNRRNLYTYDYKAYDAGNGQKYGVDIYVTDDNGINVGLNTSEIVTYFYFNDVKYPISLIPQNPDKLHVTTYIFENQTVDSVFEVISSPKNVLVNSNSVIHYKINNLDNYDKTVVFDLDDNLEFVNALVSQGNYHYDSTQNKLFWDITGTSKEIMLYFKPKSNGFYKIRSYVEGIDEELKLSFYATDLGAVLRADNVTTYKTYYKSLDVYLTDNNGVPLIGEKVSIAVNGEIFYREVTPKGYAPFYIMLQPGEYEAIISYYGDFGMNQTTAKIIVEKTLLTEDLVVSYEDADKFNIFCLDENGTALPNSSIDIRIDGVLKNKYTGDDGYYRFDISNLDIGNHIITSFNGRTNEFVTNLISIVNVTKTELKANAVTATYNIKKNLVITLTSSKGIIEGAEVSVKVGTISKTLKTNSKGQVSVDISSLVPKNSYTATIKFAGNKNYIKSTKSVKVTVKKATPKIAAKAKTFKKSVKTKKYTVKLNVNQKVKVAIKVNKKTYYTYTNTKGKATFKITKLTKKGKHTATVSSVANKYYNKAKPVKVKITIK